MNGVCAKFMAEAGFSVCHCSVSSVARLRDTSENTLLTEQWHTVSPTLRLGRVHTFRLIGDTVDAGRFLIGRFST